jgi:DNA (cytosine-5)-methyltransferase 1
MIKHVELFAGIGGFRKAIDLLGKDFEIPVECIAYSEKDKYAISTYKSNFKIDSEIEIGDITEFTKEKSNIKCLPDFDLLTGGFPCQSFSMMGNQDGLKDERGNLFYRILDIISVKKPKFLLLENVKNLKNHDKGNSLKTIILSLKKAGYKNIYFDVFNSSNFGLAQTRNRIFIFATIEKKLPSYFSFNEDVVINSFGKIKKKSLLLQSSILDVLENKVDSKYYLSDKIKPTILSDGSSGFKSKSEINQLIARPLTASMVKMHRACQDNYYSDNFLKSKDKLKFLEKKFSKKEIACQNIRKITPKEALLLQGFDNKFYLNSVKAEVSDHQLYKQAGNAVSVNTVYAILNHLFVENNLLKLK